MAANKPDPSSYHDALYQLASTAAQSSASPDILHHDGRGHPAYFHQSTSSTSSPIAPTAVATAATSSHASSALDKKISCMECRLSKVKCAGGEPCPRCQRLHKECYYKSHKRGRKSDSSKIQKLEKTVDSLSKALEHFSNQRFPSVSFSPVTTSTAAAASISHPAASTSSSSSFASLSEEAQSTTLPPAQHDTLDPNSQRKRRKQSRQSHSSQPTARSNLPAAAPALDDPDEPHNLGLPTLSNPLKLLAHASDSARDRDLEQSTDIESSSQPRPHSHVPSIDPALKADSSTPGIAPTATPSGVPQTRKQGHLAPHAQTHPQSTSRFGPARGKAFFSVGLFSPKPDSLTSFDPVRHTLLTLAEAQSLFADYMQYINPPLTLLDPHLHTFEYVRSSSPFLLSSACWIAAKHRVEAPRIAADLEAHIRTKILPAILLEGFRSAEIAQAFVILAAYHPPTNTLAEDRSWSYLGYGIRIASELDMNSKIVVRPESRENDEQLARRLRNRERTWLNLWLFETSLSQHMGRRPTLATDPVVMGCTRWHLDKYALPEDKAMVAVVQLRLVMMRNIELFENFVDTSNANNDHKIGPQSVHRTAMQVQLFRKTCATDLEIWLASWSPRSRSPDDVEDTAKHSASNRHSDKPDQGVGQAANGLENTSSPRPPRPPQRLERAKLYYWYAKLILESVPLKCSDLGIDVLRPIYKDAYACAMAYLGLFVATMVPNGLLWGHNSTVVTPAYCAIFALRITGLVSAWSSASATTVSTDPARRSQCGDDRVHGADDDNIDRSDGAPKQRDATKSANNTIGIDIGIDAEYTFDMVEQVIKVFEEAGNVTSHRQSAAGSYAPFLSAVLAKTRAAWKARHRSNSSVSLQQSVELPRGKALASSLHKKRRFDGVADEGGGSATQKTLSRNGSRDVESRSSGVSGPESGSGGSSRPRHPTSTQDLSSMFPGQHGHHLPQQQEEPSLTHHFMQFQAGPSGVQAIPEGIAYSHDRQAQGWYADSAFGFSSTADNNTSSSNGDPGQTYATVHNDDHRPALKQSIGQPSASSPSTSTINTISATAGRKAGENGNGNGNNVDWDLIGILDGFLGESLFSDMSFISDETLFGAAAQTPSLPASSSTAAAIATNVSAPASSSLPPPTSA